MLDQYMYHDMWATNIQQVTMDANPILIGKGYNM